MESLISISVSIISSGSDFDIRLDGVRPAQTHYNQSMQIVEFAATPGSHALSIEERRAYKSRLWWLPSAVRSAIRSFLHDGSPDGERGNDPQYLLYRGALSTAKTVQLEFIQENDRLITMHGDVQECFNAPYFDSCWRNRLVRYRLLPLMALSIPLAALSIALHIYAATIGNTIASVCFAVIATAAIGFTFIRMASITRVVKHLIDKTTPAPPRASSLPRSRR